MCTVAVSLSSPTSSANLNTWSLRPAASKFHCVNLARDLGPPGHMQYTYTLPVPDEKAP